jgi:hypothetical protein
MDFIIVYDKETGKAEKVIPEDPKKSLALFNKTTEDYASKKNVVVNLVSADNEQDLHKYWGRFFR